MASNFRSFSIKTFPLRFTIFILLLYTAVAAVPERELESMLAVLRSRGYSLFGNAIATSDIYYEVLSGTSFTFFAPTDSSLFALDMTTTAPDYTAALRRHVIPRRLSIADLRALPSSSTLRTLVPRHDILVQRRPESDTVIADGIDVIVPGLFYGRDIAVHGLGGILSYRSQIGPRHGSPPPLPEAGNRQSPHPKSDLYGHHGYWTPVVEHHRDSPPPETYSDNYGRPVVEHHRHSPPPETYSGNYGRPVVVHPQAPLPPANLSDNGISEPPTAERTGDHIVVPPVLSPPSFDPFSPVDSPGLAGFEFDIEFSPEISIGPPLAPSTSIGDVHPISGEGWTPMQPVLTMVAAYGTMATADIPLPLDPETPDCPVKESETLMGHVSVQPGNPLILQHYTMSTCARR